VTFDRRKRETNANLESVIRAIQSWIRESLRCSIALEKQLEQDEKKRIELIGH